MMKHLTACQLGKANTAQVERSFSHQVLDENAYKLTFTDKRRADFMSKAALYDRLSLAQKFSASQLFQYGYSLYFLRGQGINTLAIFIYGSNIATVDFGGDIDLAPKIQLRE